MPTINAGLLGRLYSECQNGWEKQLRLNVLTMNLTAVMLYYY